MEKLLPWVLTLRGRLFVLVCLTTLPAFLFTLYVAETERRATTRRIEDDARHLAGLAAREHAHQIQGAQGLAQRIGELLTADPALLSRDARFLPTLLEGFPQFANVFVLGPDGVVRQSAKPVTDPINMADNPALTRAMRSQETEVGSYLVGPIVHRPVLHVAHAVRGTDGVVREVVFVAVDLRWLQQLTEQLTLPRDSTLLIADRDGRVLARSGAMAVAGTAIPGLARLPTAEQGQVLDASDGGPPLHYVAAPMEGTPGIFVAAGTPYARVRTEANRAFYRALVVLALVTVTTVVAAFLAAEISVLRAVRGLSHAARRLGEGELAARAPVPASRGEIRDLALSFNAMADALARRHHEALEARDRLRALSAHLQDAREAEAGRIARELHDEIGQVLTSLKFELAALRRCCPQNDSLLACSAALAVRSDAMLAAIDRAVDFVRRIASELRPAVLDRLGLAAGIEWLGREIEERTDLAVETNVHDQEAPVHPLVATTTFRIAQEALTNVKRHAGASMVRIELVGSASEIDLTIADNGRGIDMAALERAQSLGITGMRERAQLVGGTLSISAERGQGTTIRLVAPRHGPKEA